MNIHISMTLNGTVYELDPDHPNFPNMFNNMTPFQLVIAATYMEEIGAALHRARDTKNQHARPTSGAPSPILTDIPPQTRTGWLAAPTLADGNVPTWQENEVRS